MRLRATHVYLPLFLSLSLTFAGTSSAPSEQSGQANVRPAKETVLFAVWAAQKDKKPPDTLVDPILLIRGDKYVEPPTYDYDHQKESDELFRNFEEQYYRPRSKYPLFFGGEKVGHVDIKEAVGISCVSLTATVRVAGSLTLRHPLMAMAASGNNFGLHPRSRRSAVSAEEAELVRLAREFYGQQGVRGLRQADVRILNLAVTRLTRNSGSAFVGSVTATANGVEHRLFLIAEQKSGKYGIALASYHQTTDMEYYKDDAQEQFVDQLDVDNDGQDEVITITVYYESWDYVVYKRGQSGWHKVYQGGGGGC